MFFQVVRVPVYYKTAVGSVKIVPDRNIFEPAFPVRPLRVCCQSSLFSVLLYTTYSSSLPPYPSPSLTPSPPSLPPSYPPLPPTLPFSLTHTLSPLLYTFPPPPPSLQFTISKLPLLARSYYPQTLGIREVLPETPDPRFYFITERTEKIPYLKPHTLTEVCFITPSLRVLEIKPQ